MGSRRRIISHLSIGFVTETSGNGAYPSAQEGKKIPIVLQITLDNAKSKNPEKPAHVVANAIPEAPAAVEALPPMPQKPREAYIPKPSPTFDVTKNSAEIHYQAFGKDKKLEYSGMELACRLTREKQKDGTVQTVLHLDAESNPRRFGFGNHGIEFGVRTTYTIIVRGREEAA